MQNDAVAPQFGCNHNYGFLRCAKPIGVAEYMTFFVEKNENHFIDSP